MDRRNSSWKDRKNRKRSSNKKTRKYIVDLLAEKFDFVPKGIRESIAEIEDEAILDELLRKIIKIQSLEQFNELLKKAKDIWALQNVKYNLKAILYFTFLSY